MNIYLAWVGAGRFLVRSWTEEEAIALARKEAENHNPSGEAEELDAGADLLDAHGDPEVLDVDYS